MRKKSINFSNKIIKANKQLNILYINSGSEGVGTYFRSFFWAKYLVKKGHKVTIICAHNTPSNKLISEKSVDGIRIINLIKTKAKWDYPGYIIRTFLIMFLCIVEKYDILHSFVVCQPPSGIALIAARIKVFFSRKKTVIFADWDDWWGEGGISEEHNWLVRKGIAYMEKNMPALADAITVCSGLIKDKAISFGYNEDKIFNIPNGSNIDTIRPIPKKEAREKLKIAADAKLLGYVGQFHTTCFPLMLKSFEKVIDFVPGIRLMIIGNIPEIYKELVRNNKKIYSSIDFVGKIPYSQIGAFLSAADILLLPMDNTIVDRARWPIRFGDYLAAGRPIVVSSVGEMKRAVERYGCALLANLNGEESFSDKIVQLIGDEFLQEKLGSMARRVAEDVFSWEKITDNLSDLYNNQYGNRIYN